MFLYYGYLVQEDGSYWQRVWAVIANPLTYQNTEAQWAIVGGILCLVVCPAGTVILVAAMCVAARERMKTQE
jgi:CHASE1-domain containing sensor protein